MKRLAKEYEEKVNNLIAEAKNLIMKNTLHFTSKHPKAQALAFNAIYAEQESIGYYALPEQDISALF